MAGRGSSDPVGASRLGWLARHPVDVVALQWASCLVTWHYGGSISLRKVAGDLSDEFYERIFFLALFKKAVIIHRSGIFGQRSEASLKS